MVKAILLSSRRTPTIEISLRSPANTISVLSAGSSCPMCSDSVFIGRQSLSILSATE